MSQVRILYRPGLAVLTAAALAAALSAQTPSSPAASGAAMAAHPVAAAAPTLPASTVLATVGAHKITEGEMDALISTIPPQFRSRLTTHKRQFVDSYAHLIAVAQAAHAQGLDQTPKFRAQLRLQKLRAEAQAYQQWVASNTNPSPADISQYYKQHQPEFQQAQVRHILITSQQSVVNKRKLTNAQAKAKAEALYAQLQKGADFATLAKQNSDDPQSKIKGGDLGYLGHNFTTPVFDHKIWTTPVGKITPPFQTPFGWHILQVQDVREEPLAQATPVIEQKLKGKMIQARMQQTATAAHIVFNDAVLPPPPAPPAVPAAAAGPQAPASGQRTPARKAAGK